MKPSPIADLANLLGHLFSSAARITAYIRSFTGMETVVKELPGDTVPVAEMASSLASRLQEHGLITRDFFIALARNRPHRANEVRRTAEAFGIPLEIEPPPPYSPSFYLRALCGEPLQTLLVIYNVHSPREARCTVVSDPARSSA